MPQTKKEHLMGNNPFEQLTAIVYRKLFSDIEHFNIKPGDRINATKLAKELNISRTPVAEALKLLEKIGLVEKNEKHNGWHVTPLSRKEAADLCIARATIEAKAAFLCAQRGACPHINEIEHLAKQYCNIMESGGDCDTSEQLDTAFHRMLLEDCGNRYLQECYNVIAKGLLRYQRFAKRNLMAPEQSALRDTVKSQHLSIVNAIRLCMPELAQQEMQNHMNTCFAIIMSTI